jgi:hypothetical protein
MLSTYKYIFSLILTYCAKGLSKFILTNKGSKRFEFRKSLKSKIISYLNFNILRVNNSLTSLKINSDLTEFCCLKQQFHTKLRGKSKLYIYNKKTYCQNMFLLISTYIHFKANILLILKTTPKILCIFDY